MNVDPDRIIQAITPRTRAIIPVHFAGLPADMSAITRIARDHGLAVIEDAAHAFPASCGETKIGSASDFTCFSFYATKSITTGEGGMICTNDDVRADRCRIMALHGISRDAWKRYAAEGSWYYEIIAPGYKYNMTDIAAAIGLVQLSKAEMMWRRRREIAERYTEAFREMPELETPVADDGHAWHLYPVRLNLHRLTIDRAAFVEELRKLNIGTSVHFIPLHMHPYYQQLYGFGPRDFPVSHDEYLREVSLPIYSKMTDEDALDVVDAVQAVVESSLV
jgi:dTDP-4-amino-4,6-dideoxygalactose transaminase